MNPFEATTVRHRLILRIEFSAPVLEGPVFRSDATWLRTLGQAIARSGCVPAENGQPCVMLRLMLPATETGAFAGPSDPIDGDFVDTLVSVLASQGWMITAAAVLIREEAVERNDLLLEVAIYDVD